MAPRRHCGACAVGVGSSAVHMLLAWQWHLWPAFSNTKSPTSLARMSDDDTPHTEDGSSLVTESSIRALIRAELRAILPNPTASTASTAPTTSVVTSTSHSGKPNHKAHVLPVSLARHSPVMQSVSTSVISITVHTHVAGWALGQARYYLWRRIVGRA